MVDAANIAVAETLRQMADKIEQQRADPYRGSAYRRAARAIEQHDPSIEGRRSLQWLGWRRLRSRRPASMRSISVLLDVDREYREKAAAGELRTLAPKRFNPSGEAWLPAVR